MRTCLLSVTLELSSPHIWAPLCSWWISWMRWPALNGEGALPTSALAVAELNQKSSGSMSSYSSLPNRGSLPGDRDEDWLHAPMGLSESIFYSWCLAGFAQVFSRCQSIAFPVRRKTPSSAFLGGLRVGRWFGSFLPHSSRSQNMKRLPVPGMVE